VFFDNLKDGFLSEPEAGPPGQAEHEDRLLAIIFP
jgi:hypothetical protein